MRPDAAIGVSLSITAFTDLDQSYYSFREIVPISCIGVSDVREYSVPGVGSKASYLSKQQCGRWRYSWVCRVEYSTVCIYVVYVRGTHTMIESSRVETKSSNGASAFRAARNREA